MPFAKMPRIGLRRGPGDRIALTGRKRFARLDATEDRWLIVS
jgi:hypothetical protein